jgi:hypothetical protein
MSKHIKPNASYRDEVFEDLVSIKDTNGNEVLRLSPTEQITMLGIINCEDFVHTSMPVATLFAIWYAEVFMGFHPMVDPRTIDTMNENLEFIEGIFVDMFPQSEELWPKLRGAFTKGMEKAKGK